MSTPVATTRSAQIDIAVARAWYEAQQTGRGDVFLDELRDQFDLISQNPAQYGLVDRITRAALMPYSKYVVYYRVEPNEVVVVAVQHASADPRKWQRR